MNKYFRTSNGTEHLYGIIENIPDDCSLKEVKERIETVEGNSWSEIVDEEYDNPDIILDWESIDYETTQDIDMTTVIEIVDIANENELTVEVVYTSLKKMKENSELSIADSIKLGLEEWIK